MFFGKAWVYKHTACTHIYTCAYTEQYHSLPAVCINPAVFYYVECSCFLILCKASRSLLIFQTNCCVYSPSQKHTLKVPCVGVSEGVSLCAQKFCRLLTVKSVYCRGWEQAFHYQIILSFSPRSECQKVPANPSFLNC